jgi:hypothetical protein
MFGLFNILELQLAPLEHIINNCVPFQIGIFIRREQFFDPTPIMTSMEQSQFSQINEHYGNNRISNVNETIECNNMTHTNSKVRFFLNFH